MDFTSVSQSIICVPWKRLRFVQRIICVTHKRAGLVKSWPRFLSFSSSTVLAGILQGSTWCSCRSQRDSHWTFFFFFFIIFYSISKKNCVRSHVQLRFKLQLMINIHIPTHTVITRYFVKLYWMICVKAVWPVWEQWQRNCEFFQVCLTLNDIGTLM